MSEEGFEFRVLVSEGNRRVGELMTPHGVVRTPVFMPVGTAASVKAVDGRDLEDLECEMVLANTYHLYLRPGDELIKAMGGVAQFMRWKGPVLTDSGGFQVSSLGHFRMGVRMKNSVKPTKIDEQGVTFWSHLDGSRHRLNAERSIEIQENLGADVIMAFDEATPDRGREYAKEAMKRTHKWLVRGKKKWVGMERKKEGKVAAQMLLGIIQGGGYKDLRRQSAEFVVGEELFGNAVGGGTIGQDADETEKNVSWIRDLLPREKPLYLMGVGVGPSDAIRAVESGADLFDCVAPTRIARMGGLYAGRLEKKRKGRGWEYKFVSEFEKGRLNIANNRFSRDNGVIVEGCGCYTCVNGYSRAYLRHLFVARELSYYRLASIHNLYTMIKVVGQMREEMLSRLQVGKNGNIGETGEHEQNNADKK